MSPPHDVISNHDFAPRRSVMDRLSSLRTRIATRLFWSWRFRRFGSRSVLKSPQQITGAHLIEIGNNVDIWHNARLEAFAFDNAPPPIMTIGDGTMIQRDFHCGAAQHIAIGREVLMGSGVFITDHDHSFDDPDLPPIRQRQIKCAAVTIGDGAWLGERCMILKGVTVGQRAVVAAGAIVTHDVAPFTVVAGVPAKPVSRYDFDRKQWVSARTC